MFANPVLQSCILGSKVAVNLHLYVKLGVVTQYILANGLDAGKPLLNVMPTFKVELDGRSHAVDDVAVSVGVLTLEVAERDG